MEVGQRVRIKNGAFRDKLGKVVGSMVIHGATKKKNMLYTVTIDQAINLVRFWGHELEEVNGKR